MNRISWGRVIVGGHRCLALAAAVLLSCSTGDPDPEPAEGGRIQRTIQDVDSAMDPARDHIRAIDSLGEIE